MFLLEVWGALGFRLAEDSHRVHTGRVLSLRMHWHEIFSGYTGGDGRGDADVTIEDLRRLRDLANELRRDARLSLAITLDELLNQFPQSTAHRDQTERLAKEGLAPDPCPRSAKRRCGGE